MKKKLAIVGSGISAMTCAYYLRDDYQISIFDKNDYLGGHTHTHVLNDGKNDFTIDTGFIVFNEETYKNMLRLFSELGVEKQKGEMSFSVYNKLTNLQYSGASFSHLFSQKKNLFSPRYWKFLLEINTFFKEAIKDHEAIEGSEETIKEYCQRKGLSDFFIDNYLGPMSSAVWSTPQKDIYNFPISLLLPFFYNHGLLGLNRQFQWYTVRGGSNDYIKKIIKSHNYDIHLGEEVLDAREEQNEIVLKTIKDEYRFDFVILASHSNESLKIAKNISEEKKNILYKFDYFPNKAVLHTDESVMPPIKKTWAAWNHIVTKDNHNQALSSTVYWMNKLQKPKTDINYFVSINPFETIDKSKIIKEINYEHPNFTVENFSLQKSLKKLNENSRIFFAGAYFGYGFHEDGLKSGLDVVSKLKIK